MTTRIGRTGRRRAILLVTAGLVAATVVAWGQPGFAQAPTAATASAAANPDAQLVRQLADARLATARYSTSLDAARRDGYGIITQMIPNMGYHFMNPSIGVFDVRRPQILVYEHHGATWQLGALEWVFTSMPATPPLPDATFGLFPAACHYVDGTFVPEQSQQDCPARSPQSGAAFNFWHPPLFTMHVWAWYPNPAGLYSSTNPLVAPFNNG